MGGWVGGGGGGEREKRERERNELMWSCYSTVIIRCQLFPLTQEVRCRTDFFCSAAPFTLTLEQCCVTPTARTYTVDGIEGCFTCIGT